MKITVANLKANLNMKREVVYTPQTKFLFGHSKNKKPGSADEVKQDYFISCSGSYGKGKAELYAKQCVYRETK